MKGILIYISFVLVGFQAYGQNLIKDPGFETPRPGFMSTTLSYTGECAFTPHGTDADLIGTTPTAPLIWQSDDPSKCFGPYVVKYVSDYEAYVALNGNDNCPEVRDCFKLQYIRKECSAPWRSTGWEWEHHVHSESEYFDYFPPNNNFTNNYGVMLNTGGQTTSTLTGHLSGIRQSLECPINTGNYLFNFKWSSPNEWNNHRDLEAYIGKNNVSNPFTVGERVKLFEWSSPEDHLAGQWFQGTVGFQIEQDDIDGGERYNHFLL